MFWMYSFINLACFQDSTDQRDMGQEVDNKLRKETTRCYLNNSNGSSIPCAAEL